MSGWLAPQYIGWIAHGFLMTVVLSASACVAATALGFGLALARDSRHRLPAALAAGYVLIFRNSPLLVQLLFWYFGVATLLPGNWMAWLNAPHAVALGAFRLSWPSFEFLAGWVGLTCYTATFIGEEFRAGIRGVRRGQYEAAAALGLSPFVTFRYVILPQAIRIAMPSLAGQYMNAVKNSSLAMAIGVAELSYEARQVDTETFKTFQAFGAATVLYISIIAVIEVALAIRRRRYLHT